MTTPTTQIQVPVGMVCMTTWGSVTAETMSAWCEMRSAVEQQGLRCPWVMVPGSLVDRARNQAVGQMLQQKPPMGWLLFVDGDAVFAPDALSRQVGFP